MPPSRPVQSPASLPDQHECISGRFLLRQNVYSATLLHPAGRSLSALHKQHLMLHDLSLMMQQLCIGRIALLTALMIALSNLQKVLQTAGEHCCAFASGIQPSHVCLLVSCMLAAPRAHDLHADCSRA